MESHFENPAWLRQARYEEHGFQALAVKDKSGRTRGSVCLYKHPDTGMPWLTYHPADDEPDAPTVGRHARKLVLDWAFRRHGLKQIAGHVGDIGGSPL